MEPVDLTSSSSSRLAPPATAHIDLSDGDAFLTVDISDALSERDWVKFTVHTKTSLPHYSKQEMSVIRLHEEFIWLHDTLHENRSYEGCIIPPPPPRPDFDVSREKLRKLGDAEGNLTKEEFNKLKQELEAEYLATFKKTVAMHETFLCRLATHPIFKFDENLRIFLEYEQDLNVRNKNTKEKVVGLWGVFRKQGDAVLLHSKTTEVDDYFDREKSFIVAYHNLLRECTVRADKMTAHHKNLADTFIKVSVALSDLGRLDNANTPDGGGHALEAFIARAADALDKMRRIEGRVASDQDLKLSDTLRYHSRDLAAAKDLLYRRLKALSAYELANKELERARARNRDVAQAEHDQQTACQRFEHISEKAKDELATLRSRRVAAFQKSLTELAELELKHSRSHAQMLKGVIAALRADHP